MKRSKHEIRSSTKLDPASEAELRDFAERLTFLTGRVVQFVQDLSQDAGVPAELLAERVSEQLGNGESREEHRSEERMPSLPPTSTTSDTKPRKVAMARRSRRKLSGQKIRAAKDMLASGASINSVAKKYHISWLKANALRKAA